MLNFKFFGNREQSIPQDLDSLEEVYKLYYEDDEIMDQEEWSAEVNNTISSNQLEKRHKNDLEGGNTEETESPKMTKEEIMLSQRLNSQASTEDLMERYQIQDQETLVQRAADSYYFLRDDKSPINRDPKDYTRHRQDQELAIYYEGLLINQNPASLPFSLTEWAKLSEIEQARLPELYFQRQILIKEIAAHNASFRRFDRPDSVDNSLVYSSAEVTQEIKVPQYNPQKDWSQYQVTVNNLSQQLLQLDQEINSLENKMIQEPVLDNLPEYVESEIKLQEECLEFLRIRDQRGANQRVRPKMADDQELNNKDILEIAQEGALVKVKENKMDKGIFKEENHKGHRQLFFIYKFQDPQSKKMKYIKYFLPNQILPVGNYAFEPDYQTMFVSKINPNFAFARVKLLVSLEDIKKFGQELKTQIASLKNKNRVAS